MTRSSHLAHAARKTALASRRVRRSAELRERLFRAALALFGKKGFAQTTVEDITEVIAGKRSDARFAANREYDRHEKIIFAEDNTIGFFGQIFADDSVDQHVIEAPIHELVKVGAPGILDLGIFLGEYLKISPSAVAEASNGLMQLHVEKDEHAIGFVSFAYTAGIHPVSYQGVACNLANARSGQYEGVRNFWMVTKGAPKGEAAKFISWVTSGKKQVDSIINSSWIAVH